MTNKTIKAFTDYPRPSETFNRKAPLRRIEIVRTDGDKYALVRDVATNTYEVFKAGYCYRTRRKTRFYWKTLERNLPVGWLYDDNGNPNVSGDIK